MAYDFWAIGAGRLTRFVAGVCVVASTVATFAAPAEAHHWRRHYSYHRAYSYHHAYRHHYYARRAPAYAPPFAAMVVDANSGRTLYAAEENELRHPASITKVMTLYLLFDELEKGRMTLETPIEVSAHAASQAPSKLGLEPGETISVENAIKAVVTRSANDIAVAIAEKIGGDESSFAEMMTREAHSLGMSRTVYHNASGLPDDGQVTTARDLTILARAVQERFPRYFHYFSTHSFEYAGEVIGNHNHLLGRVDGVDGIKTGYTQASGFNLMTSVHRDGRSLVAVVMGGRSASARDYLMEQLIDQHIAQAAAGGHSAPVIAENAVPEPVRIANSERSRPAAAPAPRQAMVAKDDSEQAEGDDDETAERAEAPAPAHPVIAERPAVHERAVAQAAPIPVAPAPQAKLTQTAAVVAAPPAKPAAAANPAALGWVKGPASVAQASKAAAKPAPAPIAKTAVAAKAAAEETRVAKADEARTLAHDGWMIQIAATDDAGKANEMLSRAKAQNRVALASAKAFTEKVQKGDSTLYRARFAGLDSATAEAACRNLKRTGFSCFAMRD